MELGPVTDGVLESQLKGLSHPRTRAGAAATLVLLMSRISDAQAQLLLPHVPELAELLATGGGPDEPERDSIKVGGLKRARAANGACLCGAAGRCGRPRHMRARRLKRHPAAPCQTRAGRPAKAGSWTTSNDTACPAAAGKRGSGAGRGGVLDRCAPRRSRRSGGAAAAGACAHRTLLAAPC